MQRMPVVSSEFRIGAFERRVSMGFGFLDAAGGVGLVPTYRIQKRKRPVDAPVLVGLFILIMLRRIL